MTTQPAQLQNPATLQIDQSRVSQRVIERLQDEILQREQCEVIIEQLIEKITAGAQETHALRNELEGYKATQAAAEQPLTQREPPRSPRPRKGAAK